MAQPPLDLAAFDVVMFDCDGVLFRGSEPVAGCAETLARLEQLGKRVFFVTNNATKSREDNAVKLRSMGMPAHATQFICSAYSAATYVAKRGHTRAFVVGEAGLRAEMALAGVVVADQDCSVVVVGLDRQFHYDTMASALSQLQQGAEFVATNRDSTYPAEGGRILPGAGSIVAAMQCCSGVQPVVTGKPSTWFVEFVQSVAQADPARCLMVGDRLDTDVAFGRLAGFATLLVTETGVHTSADAAAAPADRKPHYCLARAPDLLAFMPQ